MIAKFLMIAKLMIANLRGLNGRFLTLWPYFMVAYLRGLEALFLTP